MSQELIMMKFTQQRFDPWKKGTRMHKVGRGKNLLLNEDLFSKYERVGRS